MNACITNDLLLAVHETDLGATMIRSQRTFNQSMTTSSPLTILSTLKSGVRQIPTEGGGERRLDQEARGGRMGGVTVRRRALQTLRCMTRAWRSTGVRLQSRSTTLWSTASSTRASLHLIRPPFHL